MYKSKLWHLRCAGKVLTLLDIRLELALYPCVFIYGFLLFTFVVGCMGTYLSIKIARACKIFDDPQTRPDSKKHKAPIPLLGGIGFCLGTICMLLVLSISSSSNPWLMNNIESFNLLGIIAGFLFIITGGILDDIYTFTSKTMLCWILAGVGATVFFGDLGIEGLSYPFDTFIPDIAIVHSLLACVWIVACIAATKFLDGLDGLVGSVGIVSFLTIASVASFSYVDQPFIILASLGCAILLTAFLIWNFPNAKAYLGESGSEAVGYWIGVLSIASGAKIATASSVIGWFVLDIACVIILRYFQGNPIFKADRQHWHHRLVDNGLSKEKSVIVTVLIILIASHVSLIIPTAYKGLVIVFQMFTICFSLYLIRIKKQPIH